MAEFQDNELREFCTWYQVHFRKKESFKSVVTTCMCGHFHTYTRAAEILLKRCVELGLVTVKENVVHFT